MLEEQGGVEQGRVPNHRTDRDLVNVDVDVVQPGVVVDVDQHLWHREPQLHHREQTVSGRDQSGLLAVLREQCERVVDAGRTLVLERLRYLHGCLPWLGRARG